MGSHFPPKSNGDSLPSLLPLSLFYGRQAYASLWKATSGLGEYLVGSCYFLSAALTLLPAGLSIWGIVLLRGGHFGEENPQDRIYRPTYRRTEEVFRGRSYASPMAFDQWDGAGVSEEGEIAATEAFGESDHLSDKTKDDVDKY